MKGIALPNSDQRRGWPGLVASALLVIVLGVAARAQGQETAPATEATTADAGTPPSIAQPATPASSEIAEFVRQLDDDRYAVRQAAQRQLTTFGVPALELTAQIAANGTLESSTRAVNVLLKWTDSTDRELSRSALEVLAALTNRPVESAMAQERLAAMRELVAIEAIRELGGHVEVDGAYGLIGGGAAPMQIILGSKWKGGVDGLKHVADVRRATTLSLWSAPLDDAVLPKLESFSNLRRIELYGLEMTPELVEKLQEKLPNTLVEVRKGGARLGIRGLDTVEIVPNSPAAKAGLVVHDRITEFAGTKIIDFPQLTAEIAKCKPGDTVDIKFQRGTEIRETKVTFDRWGDDVGAKPAQLDVPANAQGLFGPVPRAIPRRVLPRVQIERRPLGVPGAIPPRPADPALPR